MAEETMKASIEEAFFKLSKTKNIDRITVKDLVEECGISRQSFYYHFRDIFDVSEWSLRQEMNKTLQKSADTDKPEEAVYLFVCSMKEHRDLIRKLYFSERREQLEQMLVQTIRDYIHALIQNKVAHSGISHKELDFLLDFYALGLTEYMMLHMDGELDEKILAGQIFRLLDGQYSIFR